MGAKGSWWVAVGLLLALVGSGHGMMEGHSFPMLLLPELPPIHVNETLLSASCNRQILDISLSHPEAFEGSK